MVAGVGCNTNNAVEWQDSPVDLNQILVYNNYVFEAQWPAIQCLPSMHTAAWFLPSLFCGGLTIMSPLNSSAPSREHSERAPALFQPEHSNRDRACGVFEHDAHLLDALRISIPPTARLPRLHGHVAADQRVLPDHHLAAPAFTAHIREDRRDVRAFGDGMAAGVHQLCAAARQPVGRNVARLADASEARPEASAANGRGETSNQHCGKKNTHGACATVFLHPGSFSAPISMSGVANVPPEL